MIIAIDPGDVRIGVAMFSYDKDKKQADLKVLQIVNLEALYNFLIMAEEMMKQQEKVDHVFVVENFRTDVKSHGVGTFQWNEMLTSQCIGTIKYAARRLNVPVVMQDNTILNMGRRWCDLPCPKKGHLPDDISAYIHGCHYMMKQGMIGTVDDVIKYGQQKMG